MSTESERLEDLIAQGHVEVLESRNFEAWAARQHQQITGWMTWCASLVERKCLDPHATRHGFDEWFKSVQGEDWEMVDAWIAAGNWLAEQAN
jgi:hypothetical protein